ncbi:hypothetical protein Agub_g6859, partial [Astrephomene gubernaculifera]
MGNRQSAPRLSGSAVAILGIGSLDLDWQQDASNSFFTSICRTRAYVSGLIVEMEVEGRKLTFRVDTGSLSVFTSTASGKTCTSWSPYSHEEPLWERLVGDIPDDKGSASNSPIREELKLSGQCSVTSSSGWIALCEEVEVKFDVAMEIATYRGMRLRRESWFSPRRVACCYAKIEVTSRLTAELRWRRGKPLVAAPALMLTPASAVHAVPATTKQQQQLQQYRRQQPQLSSQAVTPLAQKLKQQKKEQQQQSPSLPPPQPQSPSQQQPQPTVMIALDYIPANRHSSFSKYLKKTAYPLKLLSPHRSPATSVAATAAAYVKEQPQDLPPLQPLVYGKNPTSAPDKILLLQQQQPPSPIADQAAVIDQGPQGGKDAVQGQE